MDSSDYFRSKNQSETRAKFYVEWIVDGVRRDERSSQKAWLSSWWWNLLERCPDLSFDDFQQEAYDLIDAVNAELKGKHAQ